VLFLVNEAGVLRERRSPALEGWLAP